MLKFRYEEPVSELTSHKLKLWLSGFKQEILVPHTISAPIPMKDDLPLTQIVGFNWFEIV